MTKLLTTLALATVLALPAVAVDEVQETKDIKTGTTTITFDAAIATALDTANVFFQKAQPARINAGKGTVTYVASGGFLDLADAKAEIIHSGGITLAQEIVAVEARAPKAPKQYKTVTLLDPIITQATSGGPAVVSAVVVINGDSQGRVNVFNIAAGIATTPVEIPNNQKLTVSGASLTLTAEAATALNTAFGLVDVFTADQVVGEADVNVKFASSKL
ncbi:MAG TPA: hypothetical protein VFG14_08255 [Chthoniobacteraceae bacterium]|nr:hypothetical protein [Chthoniobacteraceae bacterium]